MYLSKVLTFVSFIFPVPNKIMKRLPNTTFCYQNESYIFDFMVSIPTAHVSWTVNGINTSFYKNKIKERSMGNGSHQLIISNCQTDVVGVVIAITNRNVGNETLYSESTLIVGKLFC